MKRLLPLILGLETLLGCAEEKPQYSGIYRKTESSVSTEEFTGDKRWSQNLEIVHRMKYEGIGFKHYLGLRFMPINDDEAGGKVQFSLSRITNEETGSWPKDHPEGSHIYSENRIYGGVWCNSQVQYWVYAVLPKHKLLDEIYPAHIGSAGKDPVTGHEYNISPNPNNLSEQYNEDKADQWFEMMEDGIEIELTLIRHLDSDTSGCYDFDGYLPPDRWGNQWTKVKYFSEEPNYHTNILEAGLGDMEVFDDVLITLFRELIPDVDSTNK